MLVYCRNTDLQNDEEEEAKEEEDDTSDTEPASPLLPLDGGTSEADALVVCSLATTTDLVVLNFCFFFGEVSRSDLLRVERRFRVDILT